MSEPPHIDIEMPVRSPFSFKVTDCEDHVSFRIYNFNSYAIRLVCSDPVAIDKLIAGLEEAKETLSGIIDREDQAHKARVSRHIDRKKPKKSKK